MQGPELSEATRQAVRAGDPVAGGGGVDAMKAEAVDHMASARAGGRIGGSDGELPRLDKWGLAGVLAGGLLLYFAWSWTFWEMWLRWFPGWLRDNWTLTQRLTEGNSYYTHGPLVPVVCLVIAVVIYVKVGAPVKRSRSATVVGWLGLLACAVLHLLSLYAQVKFVSGFALVGSIAALALIWGGWLLLRAYWIPIGFLVFMVPLPMNWIADINFQLKTVASESAMFFTTRVFGIPAVLDGSYVYLPPAADGTIKTLVVEDVCSGLRSLIALTFFATLFAMVCRVKGAWRFLMVLSALPVAVGCNIVRITFLNVVAHHWGIEAAGPGSPAHDISGLIVFAVALAVMFGLEWAVIRAGRLTGRKWSDPRLLGFMYAVPRGDGGQAGRRMALPMVGGLAAVMAIGGVSHTLTSRPILQNRTGFSGAAIPATLDLETRGRVETLRSFDIELDERIRTILQTDDIQFRRYVDGGGRNVLDTLVVFSANVRNGVHPPQVCLEGGGQFIVERGILGVDLDAEVWGDDGEALTVPGKDRVELQELFTLRGHDKTLHLFIYKYGDRYTTSFFEQQFRVFFSGLITGDSTGALIRFSTPVEGRDEESIAAARRRISEGVKRLLPAIHKGLP